MTMHMLRPLAVALLGAVALLCLGAGGGVEALCPMLAANQRRKLGGLPPLNRKTPAGHPKAPAMPPAPTDPTVNTVPREALPPTLPVSPRE